MYLAIFILFILTRTKVYYLSPIYTTMFALGQLLDSKNLNWIKPLTIILLLCCLISAPYTLTVLPVESYISYSKSLGIEPSAGEGHEMGVLPQLYVDMFGWEDFAKTVADVYHKLSTEEKLHTIVYERNYGEAGAIDFFREKYDLPTAISGHNSYWLWGYGGDSIDVVIFIGGADRQAKLEYFDYVEEAAVHINKYAMPYENNLIIYLCRGY
ncbi:hypothetical protein ACFLSV_02680 [Bacteroidota bacterium]